MLITNEEIIDIKKEAFKNNLFDVLDITPKQKVALESLTNSTHEEILFGGAAGGGKSWIGCEWLLWSCLAYPGTNWFIGRKTLKTIKKSTLKTFHKVAKKHGLRLGTDYKVNNQDSYIRFNNGASGWADGSNIDLLDLKFNPSDEEYEDLGSTEYTGGWIEEGGEVHYGAYETLISRIGRHLNDAYGIMGKLFITCNPKRNWLYRFFYKPWREDVLEPFKIFIQSFITDNPKADSQYKSRLDRLTGSKRKRLRLGDWEYEDDPTVLMEYEAMEDCFRNDHVEPDAKRKCITADIALQGSDKLVICVWYGRVLMEYVVLKKSVGRQVVTEIDQLRKKHQIPTSHVIYDSDGVGAFIGGKGGFLPGARAFVNGSPPVKVKTFGGENKKENYENLKTQCYYALADRVNNAEIWLKAVETIEHQEAIIEEFGQVKSLDSEKDGKLKIIRKDQVIENIGRSPDFADAIMMREYFEIMPRGSGRRTRAA